MEVWKRTNFEGYEVSNKGQVRSVDRTIVDKKGRTYFKKEKVLTQNFDDNGYLRVQIKGNWVPVHRLVAEYFIDNPENKSYIRHLDCNKENNASDNLQWVTKIEFFKYNPKCKTKKSLSTENKNLGKNSPKKVNQFTLTGELVRTHNSIGEAAKSVNTTASNISSVCYGQFKQSKGFIWKFTEEKKEGTI